MNRNERRMQAKAAKGSGKAAKAAAQAFKGEQLAGQGKVDDAIKAFRRATILDPKFADAHYNLGVLLRQQGQDEAAVESYIKATEVQPDYTEAYYNLGNALKKLGRNDEAITRYQKVLALQPHHVEALNNLGLVLQLVKRYDEALQCYQNAVTVQPKYADAYTNMGNVFQDLERYEEAVANYQNALAIKPGLAEAHTSLGKALQELSKWDEALASHRMALAINPNFATAHNNLAVYFLKLGRLEEALEGFRQAVRVQPDFAEAHTNMSMILFQLGQIGEGWKEYKWRRASRTHSSPVRAFAYPQWDGSSLAGKKILLWGEQGLGDEIRYASMISDLLKGGVDVTIECTARLVSLFSRSFDGADVHPTPYLEAENGQRAFDYQCSFPDLGAFLRPSIESFQREKEAYLVADPDLKSLWAKRLSALGDRPKIGLVWRGQISNLDHSKFYATIKELEPILTIPEVDFINLMYAECEDELAEASNLYGVEIKTWDDLDLKDDIDGVGALISQLDLVVCCLSAPGELAGALGVSTQCFMAEKAHFILLGSGDTSWYPSVEYTSKELQAPWGDLFKDMALKIKQRLSL